MYKQTIMQNLNLRIVSFTVELSSVRIWGQIPEERRIHKITWRTDSGHEAFVHVLEPDLPTVIEKILKFGKF